MLGSHKPGADWSRDPGTAGGYIVTADPDGLYERVLVRKADVVRPLADTDYGARGSWSATPRATCGPSATTRRTGADLTWLRPRSVVG